MSMKEIGIVIALLAFIASSTHVIYILRINKTEGSDERSSQITGITGIYCYAALSGLILTIIVLDMIFNWSAETYRLALGAVMMLSSVCYVFFHRRISKMY